MGLFWRLLAPKPLKKARRALHPSWVIEDAIVHSVRGRKQKRRRRPAQRSRARQPRSAAATGLRVLNSGRPTVRYKLGRAVVRER